MKLDNIFQRLWDDYTTQNPAAKKVYELFEQKGEQVQNDHIAFRTYNDPRINIDVLARIFIENGYEQKGNYTFDKKHLIAKHFEHPTIDHAPKVFISQLILQDFSNELQEILAKKINQVPREVLESDELILKGNIWPTVSYEVYEKLRKESEYAAWVYVYGFRANHFTVNINALKNFESIQEVNQFLKDNGLKMNDSGGEVKGSPAELLEQSSIMANHIEVEFEEGKKGIPGCYYEFARRYPDDSGSLYGGFIAKSADKIFESTDFYKK